eukprot:1143050-Pelagomonas_calceolata.AAC.2
MTPLLLSEPPRPSYSKLLNQKRAGGQSYFGQVRSIGKLSHLHLQQRLLRVQSIPAASCPGDDIVKSFEELKLFIFCPRIGHEDRLA